MQQPVQELPHSMLWLPPQRSPTTAAVLHHWRGPGRIQQARSPSGSQVIEWDDRIAKPRMLQWIRRWISGAYGNTTRRLIPVARPFTRLCACTGFARLQHSWSEVLVMSGKPPASPWDDARPALFAVAVFTNHREESGQAHSLAILWKGEFQSVAGRCPWV